MMLRRLPRHYARRTVKNLLCLGVVACLLYSSGLLDFSTRRFDTWTWTTCSSAFDESCAASRAAVARDAQVVLRTGGSEPLGRIRTHFATVLAPVPRENTIVFSDLEEVIDGHRMHDLYADISRSERDLYPEFDLYDVQRKYKLQGKDTRGLQGGWKLGKYMNLPMKRELWMMQKDLKYEGLRGKKWFIFVETDTYVEWNNLFELLSHLDPSKKQYLGSPVWLPGVPFAHGGSAYVLSYAALEALNKPSRHKDEARLFDSQYGLNTSALCCGDEALARVLKSKGIHLKGYWPLFNGETPFGLSFGRDLWCEPVISLHHVGGDDLKSLWTWIEEWRRKVAGKRPFLFKDLFEYTADQLTDTRADWDNIDDDWKIHAKISKPSFQNCKAACENDKLCFQYSFHGTTCALSRHIRIGRARVAENNNGDQYFSGWMMDRIQHWTRNTECTNARWLRSNP